jgi:hypothetical protein
MEINSGIYEVNLAFFMVKPEVKKKNPDLPEDPSLLVYPRFC